MIKEAILIAGGVAVHGARKVVKKTGKKIEEVQKQRFGKVIEQNKQEEKDHEQLWVEEEIVKKRKLLEQRVYHQYSIHSLDDQLLYLARGGLIKGWRKVEVHNGESEKLAFIEETGDSYSEKRSHPEYSIFIGGARADLARQVYEGNESYIELSHKKWKLHMDKNGVSKITDSEGFVLLEVEKKIGKRQLLNLYTDDNKLCILLFLTGMVHTLQETKK